MKLNKTTIFLIVFLSCLVFNKILLAQDNKNYPAKNEIKSDEIDSKGSEINVKNAELESIIKLFSKKTKRNYILDERVKGKVSIYLPGKVATDEAINILDAVLQLKGFTTVPIGKNIWKVIPAKDAKQTTIPTVSEINGRGSATVVTRFINLKYVSADDVKQLLSPLISSFGLINAYTATNSLILIDAEENIQRLMKFVEEMDVPFSNREMIIIPIKYATATELAATIKELLGEDSDQSKKGANEQNLDFIRARMQNNIARRNPSTSGLEGGQTALTVGAARSRAPKILADERTNSLIIVADEDTTARIRALVSELDSSVDLAGMHFYVYKCIHANASELADVLSTISSGGGATSTNSGIGNSGSSFQRNSTNNARNRESKYRFGSNNNSSSKNSSNSSSKGSANSSNSNSSSSVTFGENLSITSDPATNSLVIYGTKSDYHRVISLIKELDIKRRQVLVEALLLEVKISDSMSTSTSFLSSSGGADGGLIVGNNADSITSLLTNPSRMTDFTLAVASAGTLSFGDNITLPTQTMMLSAASQNNRVNVLSAPTILTTDNEEAEIVVGENVPFLTSTASSSENLNNTFNSIDRQDVGITLRLTPQISSRDYVKLNIFTEVSNVIKETAVSEYGPTTTIRTSQTTVIAKDSQMIVIGGLIGENIAEADSGVPYLKDIPILGHLFKGYSNSDERNNLLIFITPRIIKDQFDIRDSSIDLRDNFDDFMKSKEVHPARKDILYNRNIDKVVESEIYDGEIPGTILPPLKKKESLSDSNEQKGNSTISLKIKPQFAKTTESISKNGKELSTLKTNSYIILKSDQTSLPVEIPFTISKEGLVGIVIPAESNKTSKSFFKQNTSYKYGIKDNSVSLRVLGIYSSISEAHNDFNDLPSSWYTLSPFELMRLGKAPWSIKN